MLRANATNFLMAARQIFGCNRLSADLQYRRPSAAVFGSRPSDCRWRTLSNTRPQQRSI